VTQTPDYKFQQLHVNKSAVSSQSIPTWYKKKQYRTLQWSAI